MMNSRIIDRLLLLLAITLFVYIALHKSCGDGGQVKDSDTVYVTSVPDTIIIHDTTHKIVYKPVAVTSYVYVSDSTISNLETDVRDSRTTQNPCDSIRVYVDSIEDGVCKVVMRDSIRGELLGWSAELMSRKMETSRVDTMKITAYPSRMQVAVGAGFSDQIIPYVSLSKNRTHAFAGYGLRDKNVMVGVGYLIVR